MKHWILVCLLLALLTAPLVFETLNDAPTYDEPANMSAAYDYAYRNDFRIYPDNPPLVKLLAGVTLFPIGNTLRFPATASAYTQSGAFNHYAVGTDFLFHSGNDPEYITTRTRTIPIFFSIATGILLYFFAQRLYGKTAGLTVLALWSLDPNVRGHGHILAFDIPLTFFSLLLFYLTLLPFKIRPLKVAGIAIVITLGLLTKFTFAFVFLLWGIWFVVSAKRKALTLLKTIGFGALSFCFLWFFGLTTGYHVKTFDYDSVPLVASANHALSNNVIWSMLRTVPLPYWYKTGMQVMHTHNILSQPAMLLGQVHAKNDWWYYFPVSFLLKTPISTFLLIVFSFVMAIKNKMSKKKMFPFVIGFSFMICMMVFSHINNTFRYLFPSYAFFILGASGIASDRIRNHELGIREKWKNSPQTFFIISCFCYLSITSLFSFPYDLSYTNELTGIPPQGHKYLSDSEIDWGQDLKRLAAWLREHNLQNETITLSYLGTADPAWYGIRYKPLLFSDLDALQGILAISVGNLTLGDWQVTSIKEYTEGRISAPLDELRKRKPDAVIGKSIFVFRFNN